MLDAIPHGVVEIDTAGTIIYGNPAHHRMLGFADRELIGTSILDREESQSGREALKAFLAKRRPNSLPPLPFSAPGEPARARRRNFRWIGITSGAATAAWKGLFPS
ncbi:MAG: PAS domain-containing protein [SAR324 cluster bacterium]|nr:PAS domain-containing protein [SAR324 cluster bacterium]